MSQYLQDQQLEEQDLINELPDELIMQIFSYLTPEDLACHASKVCSRWLVITRDPSLWDGAVLVYNDLCPVEFQITIQFAPCLKRLEINMFKYMSDDTIQSILSGTVCVKCLSFYPSPNLPLNLKLDILNLYCDNLQELNLYIDDSYFFPNDTHEDTFHILSRIRGLEVLTLRGFVTSVLLKNDIFFYGWESLVSLDISGLTVISPSYITNSQALNAWQNLILSMLEYRAKTLKKLSLPEGVFDYSVSGLLESKFVSSTLENIKVCEISLIAVKNLYHIKTLHVLGISPKHLVSLRKECVLSSFPYNSLFCWISHTPQFLNIKELILENIVDDERSISLLLLNACKNLESLTLVSVCHSPAQLAHFIAQLLPSIRKLNIHYMPCLRSRHLELMTCYLPDLEVLNLTNNTLTDGILQYYRDHIQSRMPNLVLLCDWGYWNKNGGCCWQNNFKTAKQLSKPVTSDSQKPSPSNVLMSEDRERIRMVLDALTDYDDDD